MLERGTDIAAVLLDDGGLGQLLRGRTSVRPGRR